jgi:hypothetical protein
VIIMMRVLRVLVSGAAIVAAASCCESPISPSSATGGGILQLAVIGDNQLLVGEKSQLQAIATYEDGTQQNVTSVAQWASNNGGVCTVTGKGSTTGVAVGGCIVSAVVRDKTGSLPVTVSQNGGPNDPNDPDDPDDPDDPSDPDMTGLAVQGAPTVQVGQSTQWQAFAVFSNGTNKNVTATATWSSASTNTAAVEDGLIAGVSQGTTTITASYQGKTASGPIQVTGGGGPPAPTVLSLSVTGDTTIDVGESTQWQAIANLSDGSQQNVTSAAVWASGNPSIASVVAGLVSGLAPGSSPITATYGGKTGGQTVQVAPGAPQLIGIEVEIGADVFRSGSGPLNLDLDLSDLLQGNPILDVEVYGLYSDGSRQEVTSLAVIDTDQPLLSIDGSGTAAVIALLVQGLIDEDHYVNAKYGGYTANVSVELELPVLQSIGLNNGNPISLEAGNQLPAVQALFTQGISSDVAASTPGVTYQFELADGPIKNAINLLPGGNALISTVLSGLTENNGVLSITSGAATALNSLIGLLPGDVIPLDLTATLNGVTSQPILLNLGN